MHPGSRHRGVDETAELKGCGGVSGDQVAALTCRSAEDFEVKMITHVVVAIAFLVTPVLAQAQMHLQVQPDRVSFGQDDFLPRFAQRLPQSLIVPAGATATLPADSTWDAIEVGGTLRVAANQDTVVRFTHLMVLPGGRLEVVAPCGQRVTFIVRDTPLDTTLDPFQWGNGIAIFGTAEMRGCAMDATWVPLRSGVAAGATTLPLDVPEGWQVGDSLMIPDSRQAPSAPYAGPNAARRESPVRITSISADRHSVTLSKPLDFEHQNIDCLSQVAGSPYCADDLTLVPVPVANLSRNLTITSADPANRPGHLAVIGHDATGIFEHLAVVGFGRTCNESLNNTLQDLSSIGTCQAGRYALHFHHSKGVGSRVVGASLVGSHRKSKWGLVIHGTSDILVERTVCIDFPGSCFVTEDGNEARNVFAFNLAAYSDGDGVVRVGEPVTIMLATNRPGSEGACYWNRGQLNSWIGNQAWNCRFGQVFMNHRTVASRYPSQPGGAHDTDIGYRPVPIEWRDNVFVGSLTVGIDQWAMKMFPMIRAIVANGNGDALFVGAINDDVGVHLVDPHIVNEPGSRSVALTVPRAYVGYLNVERPVLQGQALALQGSGGNGFTAVRGGVIQTSVGLDFPSHGLPGAELLVESVEFRPMPTTSPSLYLNYDAERPWEPRVPAPNVTTCAHRVVNWQKTGKDYCLSQNGTATPSLIPPPTPPLSLPSDAPAPGLVTEP